MGVATRFDKYRSVTKDPHNNSKLPIHRVIERILFGIPVALLGLLFSMNL